MAGWTPTAAASRRLGSRSRDYATGSIVRINRINADQWVNRAGAPVDDDGPVPRPSLLTSLHGYQRAWVSGDLVGGLMLLVIAVPEQLATSRLAGMPPITGFYAFVAGTVVFALLGSNPQMSVGPTRPLRRSSPQGCPLSP